MVPADLCVITNVVCEPLKPASKEPTNGTGLADAIRFLLKAYCDIQK